jgi:excinuclease ABC subunit A
MKSIRIVKASEHNLRDVSLEIPCEAMTVFTGVSGSGKSSLAYDTIYREGQRRFLESLSAYARQYLGTLERPRVERIEGLSPTVSIDQKTVGRSPRSTVGTITEVYDHLRLLFARLGTPHCPRCGIPIESQTAARIADTVIASHSGRPVLLLAPIVRERKGEYRAEMARWKEAGHLRLRIDGRLVRLDRDEAPRLGRYERHTIEIVHDRVRAAAEARARLTESIEKCLELADGVVNVVVQDEEPAGEVLKDGGSPSAVLKPEACSLKPSRDHLFSSRFACARCGEGIPELEPRIFSFNSPHGACPACHGLGMGIGIDPENLVADPALPVLGGGLAVFSRGGRPILPGLETRQIRDLLAGLGYGPEATWEELSPRARDLLLHGGPDGFPGLLEIARKAYDERPAGPAFTLSAEGPCPACGGSRLRPEARSVKFRDRSIADLAALPAGDLLEWVSGLRLDGSEEPVGRPILREIAARLGFLKDVGLEYLSMDRGASTLAGGEAQRIRLAAQVGAGLQGVLFVLDEPSIGLHPRDNGRLLSTLDRLKRNGNTVLVVEHDRETMERADRIVDIGPGAGHEGGEIVGEGSAADLARSPRSVTGLYLSGERAIEVPRRRPPPEAWLELLGASHNNLKGIDVRIPLGRLVVLTGVSGSGKSSLIDGVLRPAIEGRLSRRAAVPRRCRALRGAERIDGVVEIDQSPIGRTPRSNPATYTKLFDLIRDCFAGLPEARARGYGSGRFSFNRDGGRCMGCGGAGVIEIEMQFLAPVEIVCDECGGKRYNRETLEVTYRGRSISDVLAMTVREAAEFFRDLPKIHRILEVCEKVGLGYVPLGQPATTLSGGEAQRVKLAAELHRRETGSTLYLLDEPTTGLHFEDVRTLLAALQGLVGRGNTVLVVEHNPDVMKVADWIIDLGPEGGAAGGEVVAAGTPEDVAREPRSHTGKVLRKELAGRPARSIGRRPAPPAGEGDGEVPRALVIRGASRHNLKSVDVTIPKGKMVVITGVSGSGKSSLAFDTIFVEGQRRYIESLSTYARRFLGRMESAPVESMRGLAPAIAIDQKSAPRNPRSTVATITEIHDYLRLLYARIGRPHCPTCDAPLRWTSPTRLAGELARLHPGAKGFILAPLSADEVEAIRSGGKSREKLFAKLVSEGFMKLLAGDLEIRLDDEDSCADLERANPSSCSLQPTPGALRSPAVPACSLIVDRVVFSEEARTRIAGSLEAAFERGGGRAAVQVVGGARSVHSLVPSCPEGHFAFPQDLSPRMFSFNSQLGACPRCSGLGIERRVAPQHLVAHRRRPLLDGALIAPVEAWLRRPGSAQLETLRAAVRDLGITLEKPFEDLDPEARRAILEGTGDRRYSVSMVLGDSGRRGRPTVAFEREWRGLAAEVEEWHRGVRAVMKPGFLEAALRPAVCSLCGGGRLRQEYLRVRIGGADASGGLGIAGLTALTVEGAARFIDGLRLDERDAKIAAGVLVEVRSRLRFLEEVGLGYLTLDRSAATLSGGEAQRIRLASQIGNRLLGVLYILDEPTVGLHPRDTARLLASLRDLRDLGNTVILVEHDRDTIEAADHVIDMGPGAGDRGGEVVAAGSPAEIRRHRDSLTGAYLRGERTVAPERPLRTPAIGPDGRAEALRLLGVRHHNLRDLDAAFPLGLLTAVTGVSGSGKSSLVVDVLARALRRILKAGGGIPRRGLGRPRKHERPPAEGAPAIGPRIPSPTSRAREVEGADRIRRLVAIDQSPIGHSPRSNPATYTGLWDHVRAFYARLPEARVRGYGPDRFSFNLPGGRCAVCEGEGAIRVEMHFLSDVWIPCEECRGNRFDRNTLNVRFKGHHVGEVLAMEVDRAYELFESHPKVREILGVLRDVGLGYLKLGQSSTALSGGEAQRVKLAAELVSRPGGGTFYILDEPTTGLHFDDVRRLLEVFHRLVDGGNSMVVIEHNLDVIRSADWVIDLGPEGGDGGGRIVAEGPPEAVARAPGSHTGEALARLLGRGRLDTEKARRKHGGTRRRTTTES